MQKFFKPLKIKPGQIDLRSLGALEQHEQALTLMHAQDLIRAREDEQWADVPELPLPKPYVRERIDYWKLFLSAINPRQILP